MVFYFVHGKEFVSTMSYFDIVLVVDEDCEEGYRCLQRDQYDEMLPWCLDGELDSSKTDYCVLRDDNPEPVASTDHYFRIKLWWTFGYYWQEETVERNFCIKCVDACEAGNRLYITECSAFSEYFDYVATGTFEANEGKPEFSIQHVDTGLCFEREDGIMKLQVCDVLNNSLQRFYARDGNYDEYKMIITQSGYDNYCMTQQHHPKHGERILMERCANAILDQTGYWNRY